MKVSQALEDRYNKHFLPVALALVNALTPDEAKDREISNAGHIVGAALMLEKEKTLRENAQQKFETWLREDKMKGSYPADRPVFMSSEEAIRNLDEVLIAKGVDGGKRMQLNAELLEISAGRGRPRA